MDAFPPPPGDAVQQPVRPPVAPPPVSAPHAAATPPPAPVEPAGARRTWPRRIALAGAFVVAMVGAGAVGAVVGRELDSSSPPPQEASSASLEVAAARGDGALPAIDVAGVADRIAPSVVTIIADVETALGSGGSVGTGVITTSDGEILTNAHVVDGASSIRVRLNGETEPREAELLALDNGNDLALLRISGDDFVPAKFAEPGSVRIGDEVVAIGFALDLDGDPSVTLGIVSALDRTIRAADNEYLDGLIQTDAAISSGNSGGPLVNSLGEVVGINTAVARGDIATAATNIGFAISVREALPIVDQLREQAAGQARDEGYLGIELADRDDGGQGALIVEVQAGFPAADAGLVGGDIVIAVDGAAIDGAAGLIAAIRDQEPGDATEITVLRDGEPITVTATLTERPDA